MRYDRTVSRQQLIAVLNLQSSEYRNNSDLDNVSGNAGAKWLWQLGNYWSRELSYNFIRRLSGFADARFPVKNLVDEGTIIAKGGFQLHPSWRVWAGISEVNYDNSSILFRANDSTISTVSIGLD